MIRTFTVHNPSNFRCKSDYVDANGKNDIDIELQY